MLNIDKSIKICCEIFYEDINGVKCDSSNYFFLDYGRRVPYDSGFKNEKRGTIAFLKTIDEEDDDDSLYLISGNEDFSIYQVNI